MKRTRHVGAAIGVAAALLVGACSTASAQAPDTTSTTMAMGEPSAAVEHGADDGHDMDSMNMGDPDATAAYDVKGAAVVTGSFSTLDAGSGLDVGGEAWLARHPGGTTVTIEVTGLDPDTEHIAHVHAGTCAADGGPHYQHDAEGMAHPPNEIHLAFRTDATGAGTMTAENATTASDQAIAIVVHTAHDGAPKLACADFTPAG